MSDDTDKFKFDNGGFLVIPDEKVTWRRKARVSALRAACAHLSGINPDGSRVAPSQVIEVAEQYERWLLDAGVQRPTGDERPQAIDPVGHSADDPDDRGTGNDHEGTSKKVRSPYLPGWVGNTGDPGPS